MHVIAFGSKFPMSKPKNSDNKQTASEFSAVFVELCLDKNFTGYGDEEARLGMYETIKQLDDRVAGDFLKKTQSAYRARGILKNQR